MSIEARGLGYSMNGHALLKNVSACFPAGVVTGLIGPNGAGKSTLLRLLAGDAAPHSGGVYIDNVDLHSLSLAERARRRAVMTQSSHVVFDFTVADIIEFGALAAADQKRSPDRELVRRVAEQCRLTSLLQRKYNTLSGGEQQRVQFARALLQTRTGRHSANAACYLLLDEPTASLDVANELHLLEQVRQFAAAGGGCIVVLHDLNLAARFADHLLLLHQGSVADSGPVQDVLCGKTLSEVYATPLLVEYHERLNRLVVHN